MFPALVFASIPTGIVAFIETNELDPQQMGQIEQYISQFPDLEPKLAAQGFIVLNIMLSVMIVRPIRRMSASADKISQGDFNVAEFGKGSDEIAALGTSVNRMHA